jgi:hypothetical protein
MVNQAYITIEIDAREGPSGGATVKGGKSRVSCEFYYQARSSRVGGSQQDRYCNVTNIRTLILIKRETAVDNLKLPPRQILPLKRN